MILPYFLEYANEEQRRRWFPGMAAGELLTAIAMTEPDSGSDLAGMRTTAVRDGDTYVLDGAKTFITGGMLADLVIVVARTSTDPANRRAGLTLLVVEDGMAGFTRGRKLDKLGLRVQDTAELHFAGVRVPVANRLGEEGAAFGYLGHNLPQERLAIAVGAVAQSWAALHETIRYVKERKTFGTPVASFQNTKFELAAVATEIEAAQAMLDRAILEQVRGELSGADAARVKLFCTEVQGRAMDRCLQLFGGLRLHARVPHRPPLRRCPGDPHLRRDQRGPQDEHQQVPRSVGAANAHRRHIGTGHRRGVGPRPGDGPPTGGGGRRSRRHPGPADLARRAGGRRPRQERPVRARRRHRRGRRAGGPRRRGGGRPAPCGRALRRPRRGPEEDHRQGAPARPPRQNRGAVVLIASVAAFDGQIGQTSYTASKAAVHGITLVAARDLASWQIRVNTIAPGVFDTPMMARAREDIRQGLAASVPHPKKLGDPEDYAHMALALLENGYANGDTVRLDGAIRMAPR